MNILNFSYILARLKIELSQELHGSENYETLCIISNLFECVLFFSLVGALNCFFAIFFDARSGPFTVLIEYTTIWYVEKYL